MLWKPSEDLNKMEINSIDDIVKYIFLTGNIGILFEILRFIVPGGSIDKKRA